jgi:RNA polymerase sigma factor (sigma-70 family)
MQGLEHWNDIIDDHPVLTEEQEIALAKQRDEGGRRGDEALDKLILHNLRAVVQRVEMMNCKPDLKHDLMSAGVLKLRHAATKWTPMPGRRFYHYAFMWIREGVTKEAKGNWHDHDSIDAERHNRGYEDTIMGATEDNHDFLHADALEILTERELEILISRAIEFADESDEELANRLGIKPESVCKLLAGTIRKLIKSAA